jgi:hypothetical protein
MSFGAAGKAIIIAIIVTGCLIASFYFAYLLLVILIFGGVWGIGYLIFNRDQIFPPEDDIPD